MIVKNFINFINKEIKEENEPKDTAVLVRCLCLLDIFFLSLFALLAFHAYSVNVACITLLVSLLVWFAFFCSYRVKMRTLVYVYCIALVINVIVLVIIFGLSFMFQAQLYVLFMVFFYRGAGSSAERIGSIICSTVVLLFLIFYIYGRGQLYPAQVGYYPVITGACTFYVVSKTSTIAYFFRKKFSASEEKIIKYSRRLEMLATTDPLTKLQNRRGMINHIERYVSEMGSSNNSLLTIVIGDIDFFKHINDTYGHEAGDYVLETLAKIMNEFMDGKGMVARWGGEEFLFTLENINGDYAFEEISKLLHLIERYEFSYEGTPIKVTVTFGLEEYDDHIGIDRVISKADEKLYMGKKQGRNRVIY